MGEELGSGAIVPTIADETIANTLAEPLGFYFAPTELVQAFAVHAHGNRLDAAREIAAAMREAIEEGYPVPAHKTDECEHGKYGWEACIACYDDHLEAKLQAAVMAFNATGAA